MIARTLKWVTLTLTTSSITDSSFKVSRGPVGEARDDRQLLYKKRGRAQRSDSPPNVAPRSATCLHAISNSNDPAFSSTVTSATSTAGRISAPALLSQTARQKCMRSVGVVRIDAGKEGKQHTSIRDLHSEFLLEREER